MSTQMESEMVEAQQRWVALDRQVSAETLGGRTGGESVDYGRGGSSD